MKKVLYFVLLLAEAVAGFLLINLAWANSFEIPCIIAIAVWAALLVWQIVLLAKSSDSAAKSKIRRNIALVMLIPIVSFVAMLVWLIVGLASVI